MPPRKKQNGQQKEDKGQTGSEESGDEHPVSGPSKRTIRKSLLRRIVRSHKKYELSEADQKICREALNAWRKTPANQRMTLLSQTTKKILGLYQAQHGEALSHTRAKAVEHAVFIWLRQRARSRRKAAKLGTKAYNGRNVWLTQNKAEVNKKVAELKTREENQGKPTVALFQLAVTEMMKELPEEERADLKVVASEWNATGPAEEVRKK